jgi:hypothetical protein
MPLSRTVLSLFLAVTTTDPDSVPGLLHTAATVVSSEVDGANTHLVIELVHRDDTVPHLARGVADRLTGAGMTAQVFDTQQAAADYLKTS